jgi:SAM-dependent methyltransferase
VLEVGCGSGVICGQLPELTQAMVIGLDFDAPILRLADSLYEGVNLLRADGLQLPLKSGSMHISLCHYLLLWVTEPDMILAEMVRVTRQGGWVLALAEPDYGGRIDYPAVLREMGEMQIAALRRQGADPLIGRRLRSLFHRAGLASVQVGVLGGEWSEKMAPGELESEWATWRDDTGDLLSAHELEDFRGRAERAWRSGRHILYVPTFYAVGRVDTA